MKSMLGDIQIVPGPQTRARAGKTTSGRPESGTARQSLRDQFRARRRRRPRHRRPCRRGTNGSAALGRRPRTAGRRSHDDRRTGLRLAADRSVTRLSAASCWRRKTASVRAWCYLARRCPTFCSPIIGSVAQGPVRRPAHGGAAATTLARQTRFQSQAARRRRAPSLRRQPAEAGHRQVAAPETAHSAAGRTDARHRSRRQAGDLPGHPPSQRRGHGRHSGLVRS